MTDRDRALLNILKIVFPNVNNRIYMWHTNKHVNAYIRINPGVNLSHKSRQAEDTNSTKEY